MITTGHNWSHQNNIYQQLMCGCCNNYLGSYDIVDGKEYDEIKGWRFCPYCGSPLEQDDSDRALIQFLFFVGGHLSWDCTVLALNA